MSLLSQPSMLHQVIQAIENGEVIHDQRGEVYRQEFSKKFLAALKAEEFLGNQLKNRFAVMSQNLYHALEIGNGAAIVQIVQELQQLSGTK